MVNEFEFIDLEQSNRGNSPEDGTARIYLRSKIGEHRITFNPAISKEIKERECRFVGLMKNIYSNEISIVFMRDQEKGTVPFKPMCKNGDSCHQSAPRGSKTGTQGLKGSKERSVIPAELCNHIVKISEE